MNRLGIYIHWPYCISKCPYCDFNSHKLGNDGVPEKDYIDCLIKDLDKDIA